MSKIIALFGSQEEVTKVLDGIAGWGVETTVIEGANDGELLGQGGSIAAAPPSVSSAPAPNLYPVAPYNPFTDVDLGGLDEEAQHYLAERVQRGSVVVVAEADDDVADKVRTVLNQGGGQVYDAR